MEDYRLNVIRENPISNGLGEFCSYFATICDEENVSNSSSALDQLNQDVLQNLALKLLHALQSIPACLRLPSAKRSKSLYVDLSRLSVAVGSDDVDLAYIYPLFIAVVERKPDVEIWEKVYEAVAEHTPPRRTTTSSVVDTPIRFSSGVVNSTEHRDSMDTVLQDEVGPIWVDLDIHRAFLGSFAGLEEAAQAVFQECLKGSEPLFRQGWRGWPEVTSEGNVLSWLKTITEHIVEVAKRHMPTPVRQQLVALPQKPLKGSVASRKVDVGFIGSDTTTAGLVNDWSHILAPGELKKNAGDDGLKTWLDLARYVREVFKAQETRRFVLAFTLCGSIMRIWNFDRLGVIGSAPLDINKDGLEFVSVILAFLWMDREALGFDPTVITSGDEPYIEVDQGGQRKRFILDHLMSRSPGIVTRGTTCWQGHFEGEPNVMVLKESWQPVERNEGALLRHATEKGVTNVARYAHHWTVKVGDLADDVQENIRKGLNIQKGKRIVRPQKSRFSQVRPALGIRDIQAIGVGTKRSSSQTGAVDSSSKRQRSESPTKQEATMPQNRIHQRIIMRDYGKPVYLAETPAVLLESIAQCVGGHKASYEAGILHRDISLNNIMINEDRSDLSRLGFLIDLDLATMISREEASGAAGRTGTRAFMSIGVLWGEPHSFMDDIESFFWVLFWICIHYVSPELFRTVKRFEKWNYEQDLEELAAMKLGVIGAEDAFNRTLDEYCTVYYKPLIPCLRKLRRMIFPNGERWRKEDLRVYGLMQDVLREAQKDLDM